MLSPDYNFVCFGLAAGAWFLGYTVIQELLIVFLKDRSSEGLRAFRAVKDKAKLQAKFLDYRGELILTYGRLPFPWMCSVVVFFGCKYFGLDG